MSILEVTSQIDYSSTALSGVTQINLTGYYFSLGPLGGGWFPAKPVFATSQFDNVQISSTVQFVNTKPWPMR